MAVCRLEQNGHRNCIKSSEKLRYQSSRYNSVTNNPNGNVVDVPKIRNRFFGDSEICVIECLYSTDVFPVTIIKVSLHLQKHHHISMFCFCIASSAIQKAVDSDSKEKGNRHNI